MKKFRILPHYPGKDKYLDPNKLAEEIIELLKRLIIWN